MNRTGVVCALPIEATGLTRGRIAPGRPTNEALLVLAGGIGPEPAGTAAERLLAAGARILVSWGTAAGLTERAQAGDLAIPKRVLAGDTAYLTDARLHTRLRAELPVSLRVFEGDLLHSDRLLTSPGDKRRAHENSGAWIADMESGAVARVAAAAGVPLLVVRAVADDGCQEVPTWIAGTITSTGRLSPIRLASGSLAHPTDWPRLAGLYAGLRAARRSLAVAAASLPGAQAGR